MVIYYKEMREQIKTGDVLTFRGKWFSSKLIRWWTKQNVSHVGFALWLRFGEETEDRLCILESMEPGGIRILPLSIVFNNYGIMYWQKLIGLDGHEVIGWALQQWGKPYASWLQFLSIISPRIRKLREKLGFAEKVGEERFHCSELVTRALEFGGYEHNKEPAFTTPGDVQIFPCLTLPAEVWRNV